MIYVYKFRLIYYYTQYPHTANDIVGCLLVSQWLYICGKVVSAQKLLFILTKNDDTSYMLLLAMTQGEPLLIWGQKVKGQGQILT